MISEHPADIVLLDYVEGVLEGDESQTVRRHIAGCRACRRTLAEISSAVDELERLPTAEIPHDALGMPVRRRRARVLARLAPLLLAAAAVVIALIFWKAPPDERRTSATRPPASSSDRVMVPLPAPTLESLRDALGSLEGRVIVGRLPGEEGFSVIVHDEDLRRVREQLGLFAHSDEPKVPVVLLPFERGTSQPEARGARAAAQVR